MSELERPSTLALNAWTGAVSSVGALGERNVWGQKSDHVTQTSKTLAPPIIDDRDWRHPDVGWGIILPDADGVADADKANGADAEPKIQELIHARPGAVVLRFRPELGGYLRRHYVDRGHQDLSLHGSLVGAAEGKLPRYLLIFASPAKIPWSLQYALNLSRCVGRLDDTDGTGWENYVTALISGWAGVGQVDTGAPVIWSVDHGGADITRLMANVIAEKLWQRFAVDTDAPRGMRFHGPAATGANLAEGLHDRKPAFIVTTSHGMTAPLDDAAALDAQLGLLVDGDYAAVTPAALLAQWSPNGAIWYAHACCSAGSEAESRYSGLFEADDPVARLLSGVSSAAGARTAPLPQALLGAANPVRAFIGHVEPTFDWTLRDPTNRQVVSGALVQALYEQLFRVDPAYPRATPIGYALERVFREAGAFFAGWANAIDGVNRGQTGARNAALYCKLVAMDRQSIVILGDPTVSLPIPGLAA